MEATETAFLIILLIVYFVFLSIVLAYAVVGYVLGSKGVHAIAARRGIKNPWMIWIPVVGNWTLGCISDQYQQRKYGRDPNLRKKLLIWSIITQAGSFTPSAISISLDFSSNNRMVENIIQSETGKIIAVAMLVVAIVILMVYLALAIIQTVYQYKAYYSLYASCKPNLAIAFLLLSIFTPAGPFLMFACRNSDDGMTPNPQE